MLGHRVAREGVTHDEIETGVSTLGERGQPVLCPHPEARGARKVPPASGKLRERDINVNGDVARLRVHERKVSRQRARGGANVEREPRVIRSRSVPRGDRRGLVPHVLEVQLEVAAQR